MKTLSKMLQPTLDQGSENPNAKTKNEKRVKISTFIYVALVLLTGILYISHSQDVLSIFYENQIILDNQFFWDAIFFRVIGFFIIFISLLGFCGVSTEDFCLLFTFSFFVLVAIITEVITGISAYITPAGSEFFFERVLRSGIENYNSTVPNADTAFWDSTQREFACCGIDNYTDWNTRFQNSLPLSCCHLPDGVIGSFKCDASESNVNRYSSGCLDFLTDYILSAASNLGIVSIIIAVAQLPGCVIASWYAIILRKKVKSGIIQFI